MPRRSNHEPTDPLGLGGGHAFSQPIGRPRKDSTFNQPTFPSVGGNSFSSGTGINGELQELTDRVGSINISRHSRNTLPLYNNYLTDLRRKKILGAF